MLKNSLSLSLFGLCTFLCTCGPAQSDTVKGTAAVGSIRYQEDLRFLEATISIDPVANGKPQLNGQPFKPLPTAGAGHFRLRREANFPSTLTLDVPCGNRQAINCPVIINLAIPFADSIPDVIDKTRTNRFAALPGGLLEHENMLLFFEPEDRSTPRRILLQGPTSTGRVTLPKESIADVKPGEYQLYLVKQGLSKDSTANLQHSIQTEYFTRSVAVTVRE